MVWIWVLPASIAFPEAQPSAHHCISQGQKCVSLSQSAARDVEEASKKVISLMGSIHPPPVTVIHRRVKCVPLKLNVFAELFCHFTSLSALSIKAARYHSCSASGVCLSAQAGVGKEPGTTSCSALQSWEANTRRRISAALAFLLLTCLPAAHFGRLY